MFDQTAQEELEDCKRRVCELERAKIFCPGTSDLHDWEYTGFIRRGRNADSKLMRCKRCPQEKFL